MPERRKNHLDPTIIDELNDLLDNVEKLIDLEKSKLDPELEEKKAIGVSTLFCFHLFAKGASCYSSKCVKSPDCGSVSHLARLASLSNVFKCK